MSADPEGGPGPSQRATIGGSFDARHNGLNLLRLVLAVGVIGWHSFPLTGSTLGWRPASQLLGNVFVDGFFAISGFLIVRSWISRPHLWPFLKARFLRLLPGLWVCLAVTAFVIAPVAAAVSGAHVSVGGMAHYVVVNAGVKVREWGIDGTPSAVPYPGVWDGSLWTLIWELYCYLGVAALGVAGALRYPRQTVTALFVGSLAAAAAVDAHVVHNGYVVQGARFALMFSAGALVLVWQDRVRLTRALLALAAGVLVAATLLPDYRLLAAPALAYLAIGTGTLLRAPRWNLRHDLSYGTYVYAFPAQQLLATLGLAALPVPVFAVASVVATAPLAAASWFGVERQALRLKGTRRMAAPAAAAPVAAAPAAVEATPAA